MRTRCAHGRCCPVFHPIRRFVPSSSRSYAYSGSMRKLLTPWRYGSMLREGSSRRRVKHSHCRRSRSSMSSYNLNRLKGNHERQTSAQFAMLAASRCPLKEPMMCSSISMNNFMSGLPTTDWSLSPDILRDAQKVPKVGSGYRRKGMKGRVERGASNRDLNKI